MRKWCVLIVLAIAFGWIAFAQERPQYTEDEGKILALENLWNRAEQAKDTTALSHIFAPTMVYVEYAGTTGQRRLEHPFLRRVRGGHRNLPRQVEQSRQDHHDAREIRR